SKLQEKLAVDQQARATQQDQAQKEQLRESLKPLVSDASQAYKSGNFDKAIIDLQTVTRQAPNDPDVAYALAQAYRGKKNFQQAETYLNKALSLDPSNQLYKSAMNDVRRELAEGGPASGSGNTTAYGNNRGGGYGRGDSSDSPGQTRSFDHSDWQNGGSSSSS